MVLDPPIHELPFILQRAIMDYSPRLPWMINSEVVLRHLSTRYCNRCGEYIDFPIKRRPARHIHFGRAKYRQDVYRYETRDASLFMNMFSKPHTMALTKSTYRMRRMRDYPTGIKLIFRVRGNRVFYNLRRILRAKSFHPTEMINMRDFNIFHNAEFYTIDEFVAQLHPTMVVNDNDSVGRIFHLRTAHITGVDSDRHYRHIFKTICLLMRWSDQYMIIYADLIIQHPLLLSMLIHLYPQQTVETMCDWKKTPDIFLLRMFENDVRLLRYVRERKLVDLFSRHSTWFTRLYESSETARAYFSFVDPLQDTLALRELF
jgi:hypothetical protein